MLLDVLDNYETVHGDAVEERSNNSHEKRCFKIQKLEGQILPLPCDAFWKSVRSVRIPAHGQRRTNTKTAKKA